LPYVVVCVVCVCVRMCFIASSQGSWALGKEEGTGVLVRADGL
jgi:hypothetical protein